MALRQRLDNAHGLRTPITMTGMTGMTGTTGMTKVCKSEAGIHFDIDKTGDGWNTHDRDVKYTYFDSVLVIIA